MDWNKFNQNLFWRATLPVVWRLCHSRSSLRYRLWYSASRRLATSPIRLLSIQGNSPGHVFLENCGDTWPAWGKPKVRTAEKSLLSNLGDNFSLSTYIFHLYTYTSDCMKKKCRFLSKPLVLRRRKCLLVV